MSDLPSLESLFAPDVRMGTLWRVREDQWEDQLPDFYVPKNKWHPGLSIMRAKSGGSEATVPLLHGTSGKKGPVVVKGISNEQKYDEDHTCVFGKIIAPIHLGESKLKEKAERDGPFSTQIEDLWYKEFEVVPNRNKPRLNDVEYAQLEDFLKRKMQDDE